MRMPEYVGTVAELPSLTWVAASAPGAFTGIRQLTVEVVAYMLNSGEQPPKPLPKVN